MELWRTALLSVVVAWLWLALWSFASEGGEEGSANRQKADEEMAGQVESYLKQAVAADRFSGVVLVARAGKPIFEHAYGLASRAYGVANRIDTKLNLGSMNKMFTAVAIGQLLERGKLDLSDTIAKHLPDYPNQAVAGKVTIHHLLTHTSGLGDYFTERFIEGSRERFRTIHDFFPLFVDDALSFEPGERFQYSNAGFLVLGAIIERISGQDYFSFVRDNIYHPAGMNATDAYELDRDTPNLAMGYTHMGPDGKRQSGPPRNNLFMHVIKGGPAGGGFSTGPDLLHFDQALRGHKLLNAQTTDLFLSGKVPIGPNTKYGYGFQDMSVHGHHVVGHGGGFAGISSQLDMYLDLDYTVVVLGNCDPPIAGEIARKIQTLIIPAAGKR